MPNFITDLEKFIDKSTLIDDKKWEIYKASGIKKIVDYLYPENLIDRKTNKEQLKKYFLKSELIPLEFKTALKKCNIGLSNYELTALSKYFDLNKESIIYVDNFFEIIEENIISKNEESINHKRLFNKQNELSTKSNKYSINASSTSILEIKKHFEEIIKNEGESSIFSRYYYSIIKTTSVLKIEEFVFFLNICYPKSTLSELKSN